MNNLPLCHKYKNITESAFITSKINLTIRRTTLHVHMTPLSANAHWADPLQKTFCIKSAPNCVDFGADLVAEFLQNCEFFFFKSFI